ncbi:MAG: haloacid dehalogenase-like hydrolase [Elusimicrobiaceae bacterium]|nr:haloacid dehalogenase-like hydrolase [Elusimicrobiaceae bacterium]
MSASLQTSILGINFENPFLLASAPPTALIESIDMAFEMGWSGAVLKTITPDDLEMIEASPRYTVLEEKKRIIGFQNIELLSHQTVKYWCEGIKFLKHKYPHKVIIASIMAPVNKAAWQELVKTLNDTPADAFELNFSCPHGMPEKGIFPTLNANREKMVSQAYEGMTLEEFYAYIRAFMQEDQPGFIGMKRGDIFYKPMVEIVEYLVKNKFTVYICSGSDRLMVRPLIEKNLPNIPPRQIIGSDSTIIASRQGDKDGLSYTFEKGDELILGGKNLIKNLQMNKVSVIAQEIGVQPVLAFGNSFSDASMLNYTINGNKYKALAFMLMCDDLEREYGNMQKAEEMRTDSAKYGWIPVSMRNDWKTIYGDSIKRR